MATVYGLPQPGEGTSSLDSPDPGSIAQVRAPARSSQVGEPSTSLPEILAELPLPEQGRPDLTDRLTALLDKPGTLLHARPLSFRQAYARHAECAAHYANPVAGWGRMLFGWIHLVCVKPALNYLEWATDAPLRLSIHVVLGVAVWAALLLGGYL